MLRLLPAKFNQSARFKRPVNDLLYTDQRALTLFDQNGYALTKLEQEHAISNGVQLDEHQHEQWSIRKPWMNDGNRNYGPHLNHCCLFERWGFEGEALDKLEIHAITNPLLFKLIKLKPKWGIDFSMDYVDHTGIVFEIYHMEWDSFVLEEADEMRIKVQQLVKNTDWSEKAKQMWQMRAEWIDLPYDKMSDWKCDFLNAPRERYKMAIWDD